MYEFYILQWYNRDIFTLNKNGNLPCKKRSFLPQDPMALFPISVIGCIWKVILDPATRPAGSGILHNLLGCSRNLGSMLVGGWTNPSEKYARQIGNHFRKVRDENNKYLKPPGRMVRINGFFHLRLNRDILGLYTNLLTIDPKFLGHPNSHLAPE